MQCAPFFLKWFKERSEMNKYFKSLKDLHQKASNYKVDKTTKVLAREMLEHYYESQIGTTAQFQHIVESILFAIRNGETSLEEIRQYIEENEKYTIVYPHKF